ncbi:DUF600 family protein [Burkholderia sp. Bp9012]|uniref:immunity protein YezG family protein n=1 Tax=Burkholderia sp. Bp9012 TaxID=2184562 RepID=UPI000F5A2B45|nr:immunity protein YezG family protein [Burkholderia sp. Bp9012]RQR79227.1 DUF600 family protein [Burkholderia sp. Bp9012]
MNQEIIPGADDLYPKMGQMIFDIIPGDFSIARTRVEMINDVSSCAIFYQKPDGRFQYLNDGLDALEAKFRELRNLFKSAGREAWTGATFNLSEDGEFSIELSYDDISGFGQASDRRKAWIKRNLGEDAKIDWQ